MIELPALGLGLFVPLATPRRASGAALVLASFALGLLGAPFGELSVALCFLVPAGLAIALEALLRPEEARAIRLGRAALATTLAAMLVLPGLPVATGAALLFGGVAGITSYCVLAAWESLEDRATAHAWVAIPGLALLCFVFGELRFGPGPLALLASLLLGLSGLALWSFGARPPRFGRLGARLLALTMLAVVFAASPPSDSWAWSSSGESWHLLLACSALPGLSLVARAVARRKRNRGGLVAYFAERMQQTWVGPSLLFAQLLALVALGMLYACLLVFYFFVVLGRDIGG